MTEMLADLTALTGAVFVFIAALGALRFHDLYTRMHAASKASSLGLSLLLLSVALEEMDPLVWFKAACGVLFLFLTVPVATHLLGRAAYIHHVPLWRRSVVDEMAGKYAPDHSRLEGRNAGATSSQSSGSEQTGQGSA